MRVILDTNVLVSGLLTPNGPASQLVLMVAAGAIVVCHDPRILHEYRTVLLRPRFRYLPGHVEALITQIENEGEFVVTPPLPLELQDQSDRPFIEVAVAAVADGLITGNRRHFASGVTGTVPVLSPAEAPARLATRPRSQDDL